MSAAPSRQRSLHVPIDRARPPPRSLPRADERRQAGERAEEHRPVLVVLGADQRADGRRADRAVGRRPAARSRRRRRRVIAAARSGVHSATCGGEVVEAERVLGDPLRRRSARRGSRTCIIASIRATSVPGQRLDEPVGGVGGERADRVDHDDLWRRRPGPPRSSATGGGWSAGCWCPTAGSACEWRSSDGSRLSAVPFVIRMPAPTVGAADRPQHAASPPRRFQNRSGKPIASRLWLPASLYGRIASAPCAVDDRRAAARRSRRARRPTRSARTRP